MKNTLEDKVRSRGQQTRVSTAANFKPYHPEGGTLNSCYDNKFGHFNIVVYEKYILKTTGKTVLCGKKLMVQ